MMHTFCCSARPRKVFNFKNKTFFFLGGEILEKYAKMCVFLATILYRSMFTGGGRIRDVASLIRRTDEPEIKKFFWGEKSEKTFSPEAKKIF